MRWPTPLLLCAVANLAGSSAFAYEYREHCRVANDALQIAIRWADSRPTPLTAEAREALFERAVSDCRKPGQEAPGRMSYGEWVGLVDNILSPWDFYLHEDTTARPHGAEGQTSTPLARYEAGTPPEDVMRTLGRSWIQGLFAAHLNEDHFQDRALFSFWTWHREAVRLASEGNLLTALVVNAYADHFLQDSFAPGHVRTPRREFHDAAALAMHDYYNRKGACYLPAGLDRNLAASLSSPSDIASDLQAVSGLLDELEVQGLVMKGDGALSGCLEGPVVTPLLPLRATARFDCRQARLALTLTVARSLADVLESLATRRSTNTFQEYSWTGYTLLRGTDGSHLVTPLSGTPLGRYVPQSAGGPLRLNPAVALGVGFEALPGHAAGDDRYSLSAELLTLGSPGRKWVDHPIKLPQFGLLAGYGYRAGGELSSHSATARLVVPITKLDLQISGFLRKSWYDVPAARASHLEWGGRLEMGFGLAFVGIGVEQSHALSESGALEDRLALTTSLVLLPRARWLGF